MGQRCLNRDYVQTFMQYSWLAGVDELMRLQILVTWQLDDSTYSTLPRSE